MITRLCGYSRRQEEQPLLQSTKLESERPAREITCTLLLQPCFEQPLRLRQAGCLQAALWDRAEAAPAEAQPPLWSAELEGERALHYFETAPPEAACAQLLLLGLGSALHLLAASEGAKLPAAWAPLDRYCALTPACTEHSAELLCTTLMASIMQMWHGEQLEHLYTLSAYAGDSESSLCCLRRCRTQLQAVLEKDGPGREDFIQAIDELCWAERIIVTGEALSQRLLGRQDLVQRLLESCIDEHSSASRSDGSTQQSRMPGGPWHAEHSQFQDIMDLNCTSDHVKPKVERNVALYIIVVLLYMK